MSQAFGDSHVIRDLLVEGNVFLETGLTDSYNQHAAYLQGTNVTVQFNAFRRPVPDTLGGLLKMRTAGEVVRYNYFENGARSLDMVDLEDHRDVVMPWKYARLREWMQSHAAPEVPILDAHQPRDWAAYQRSFVYGNLFDLHGPDSPSNPIHYGFDNSPYDRRPGKLHFYFNTLVYRSDVQDVDTVRLFDCCSDNTDWYYGTTAQWVNGEMHYVDAPIDGGPPRDWGRMTTTFEAEFPQLRAYNNVLVLSSRTPGSPRADFELTRWRADRLFLARNFITTGWNVQDLDSSSTNPGYGERLLPVATVYPNGNAHHHVEGVQNLLTSPTVPLDVSTFAPLAGSVVKGAAQALPPEVPAEHVPRFQLRLDPARPGKIHISARGSLTTLGAVE